MKIVLVLLLKDKDNEVDNIDTESEQQEGNISVVVQNLVTKEHLRRRDVENVISREEWCSRYVFFVY